MKMNSIIGFAILIIGTFIIIIVSILLIATLWQNQKIQGTISPIIDWLTPHNFSIKDLIQTATSIVAILIAIYALTKDSVRDNESSKRYSESVSLEKTQHVEIMNVYSEQIKLLEKYGESADSMLEQQKLQAKIAELQFENQKILTQPGINLNFQIQDTLNTEFEFDNDKWIMPELIIQLHNFGNRIAKDVKIEVRIISPLTRKIHYFQQENDSYIYPNATLNKFYFPAINLKDKDFFLMVIDIQWTDEFNNNKVFKNRVLEKCLREKNNFYTIGTATGAHIELIEDILKKPNKIFSNSPILRDYMYKVYNK